MSSFDKLHEHFNLMIKTLSYNEILTQNEEQNSKNFFKEHTFKNKKSHFQDISFNLMMTKAKMLEIVKRNSLQNKSAQLSKNQQIILQQVQKNLAKLNKKSILLEREQILSIYLEMLDIKVKSLKQKNSFFVSVFLQSIIEAMSSLLKCYFIILEYQNRKDNQIRKKSKSAFSLGTLQLSKNQQNFIDKKNVQDQELMEQIQNNMKGKSIQELITNYMKKQIDQIQQQEEICRICSNKIRIQTIEKHVKQCQKKSDLKQNIQNINNQLEKRYCQIRNEMEQINEKVQRSQQQEILKKIITALLYKQKYKREKGMIKRSESMIQSNQQRLFKPIWERHLEDYERQYGNHEALDDICRLQKEKTTIEKNLQSLQMHSLNIQSNQTKKKNTIEKAKCNPPKKRNRHNSIQSTDLSFSVKNNSQQQLSNSFCTKLNFQTKDCFKQNQSSQSSEEQESSKQESITSNKFCSQKLKNYQSKNYLHRRFSDEIDQNMHKNFISLQQISNREEEEGNISLQNFQIIKILGQGAFGKVYVVRRKQTQDIYALKIIALSQNCTQKQLQTIKNQHLIFKKIAGDHLVKAPFSFSQKSSHMFVLQYMPGGDLRQLLQRQVYFQQKAAQFYLAEIILAIQHLHKYQIIHRDLKPQNLVLDEQGHLKLTDFGLSELKMEERIQQTRKLTQNPNQIKRREKPRITLPKKKQIDHLIGTPDYIAPQIINGISTTNMTIDWWSLGVMAYELIIGARPFCADTIEDVIQNIHTFNIQWPQVGDGEGMITQKAKDLIQKLLNKDFISRFGANGADEIKAHPFFQGVNWLTIKSQSPPFQPNLSKVKEQIIAPQDKILRQEIQRKIGLHSKASKQKLKLQKFVRFDLLGSETIQSVEKLYSQKTNRLNKLKTLQSLNIEGVIEIDEIFN